MDVGDGSNAAAAAIAAMERRIPKLFCSCCEQLLARFGSPEEVLVALLSDMGSGDLALQAFSTISSVRSAICRLADHVSNLEEHLISAGMTQDKVESAMATMRTYKRTM